VVTEELLREKNRVLYRLLGYITIEVAPFESEKYRNCNFFGKENAF